MKRSLSLLIAAFMLAGSVAFAEEATLIDFGTLDADILPDENGNPTENARTVVDYSINAGSAYTDEQKALIMAVRVVFPTWNANAYAYVKPPFEIPAYDKLVSYDENGVAQEQTDEQKASGKTRFEAYGDETSAYGVVKNVGTLKSIAVTTYGEQFPHALYILLSEILLIFQKFEPVKYAYIHCIHEDFHL